MFKRLSLFGLTLVAALLFIGGTPLPTSVNIVANLTALQNTPIAAAYSGAVQRLTDGTVGAPPMMFVPGTGTCASASMVNDGASCVNSYEGNHWRGILSSPANVLEWGADPTGGTDATTAIQAALSTGQNILFPAGTFSASALTFSGNGQQIVCAQNFNTTLAQNTTSATNFITMSGYQNRIYHCFFQPTVRTTAYQVEIAPTCFSCGMDDFWIANAFNQIEDKASNASFLSNGTTGSMLGTIGIHLIGTAATHQNNLILYNVIMNNAYPLPYGTVVTWATSTAYTANEITMVNGYIYQETTATCTSASSGSGPTGFPSGTTPESAFSGRISDGTCTWALNSQSFIGLLQDNYSYSATINDFSMLNNLQTVKLVDTANTGTSYPAFDHFERLQGDHNFWAVFDGEAGFNVELDDPYACSSLNLTGIQLGGAFKGDMKVLGGRVCDNWTDGILVAAGSQITITGVAAGSNSQSGSANHNNINVAAGISNFTITNNQVGQDLGASKAPAAYGVIVQSGTSDYYTVTGNICGGHVVTACVIDGGSGTHKSMPTSGNGANW